jgi:Asp-tRNA(Asn)/Glu-tRNA(Gln) amidotransferase A subunit family amidase
MSYIDVAGRLLTLIEEAEGQLLEREPVIQAFLPETGRFERLRREGVDLLESVPAAGPQPPLFGLLAGVKDIFRVDGFETRAGSRLAPEEFSGPEAACVSRLKQAGVLILGKTVTTEFAYFSPGPTRNPHNPEHTPGGSSSGSAAAVAAGMCAFALGTQTIGSIIRPAAYCGIVGIKPSYGRVSREGVIPLSPSFDHVGFFTRDVALARRLAPHIYESWHEPQAVLKKPVLGVPAGPYLQSAAPDTLAHFEAACRFLSEAGYEVRQIAALKDFDEVRSRHQLILAFEAARVHRAWFEKYGRLYSPQTADLVRRGTAIAERDWSAALHARLSFQDRMRALMESEVFDLWIAPSTPAAAPRGLESTGDPVMNLPWTQLGFPALTLPAGSDPEGLPLGMQLVARPSDDEALIEWAADLEPILRAL